MSFSHHISLAIVVCVSLALAGGSDARLSVRTHHLGSAHAVSTPNPNSQGLTYHGGPLLTKSTAIRVYLIWYGQFALKDKGVVRDFFASLDYPTVSGQKDRPTVTKWWQTVRSYKDSKGGSVPGTVRLTKQLGDRYSLGKKSLKRAQIANLVQEKLDKKAFPRDPNGVYLVLTSKDVTMERFCMSSCGFHGTTYTEPGKPSMSNDSVVIAHVGDSSLQCPGYCAWPYAAPTYAQSFKPFVAPNSVATDGIVMNLATVLAGAVTNPFSSGYYGGNAQAPVEVVAACSGKFGVGAYPGFPGKLLTDAGSNVTYNAYGANGRKFLLPAMWDPLRSACKFA